MTRRDQSMSHEGEVSVPGRKTLRGCSNEKIYGDTLKARCGPRPSAQILQGDRKLQVLGHDLKTELMPNRFNNSILFVIKRPKKEALTNHCSQVNVIQRLDREARRINNQQEQRV